MHRTGEMLRSGDWLTRERVRLVAIMVLVASVLGFLFLIATAHGGVDEQGRPIGTDFSNVYAAGTYVLDGNPDAPFDPPQQYTREQTIFGAATPFYGWHYPPYFLFVAAALAKMPYGLALAVWQTITLAFYLLMIWAVLTPSPRMRGEDWVEGASPQGSESRIGPLTLSRSAPSTSPRTAGRGDNFLWLLLALAFPAVLINVGHGQNGFLTAALLGGALVLLDRRPLVAGILIGLLIYKPQFGLMIPIALVASSRWRAFAAAAATVALLTVVTTAAFGPPVWHAFLLSTKFSRTVVLEQGDTGWYKIQSLFAWARMWGASVPFAYVLQGALTLMLAGATAWLWRSAAPAALKAASLCLAAILATPYTLDYDLMVLAPAIAFFAADGRARGFRRWEKTALAALWLVPLVGRGVAHATLIPLAVPAMLAVFILLVRRAEPGRGFGIVPQVPVPGAGAARSHDIAAFE